MYQLIDGAQSGKWAACSGSIESTDKNPELAARREIQEETTLTDTDISLLRRGKPFSLIDDELQTEWTIHPFAFVLKDGAKDLKIDWEHTEFKFIKPEEFHQYETVPRLEFGLSRVLVGPETELALENLRDDHESGAGELAIRALEELKGIVRGRDLEALTTLKEYWAALRMVAWHLAKNGRPSMGAAIEAALVNAMTLPMISMRDQTSYISKTNLPYFKEFVTKGIDVRIAARSKSLESIQKNFDDSISTDSSSRHRLVEGESSHKVITILTISSSSTLIHCLSHLIETSATRETDKATIKLLVLESRPMFEGVSFVNALLDSLGGAAEGLKSLPDVMSRLQIEIFTDSCAALLAKDAQYIVIGADRVTTGGDVSNKVGSAAVAVLAKTLHPHCKVLAVFETDKIAGDVDDSAAAEFNAAAEVTSAWPAAYATALKEKEDLGFRVAVRNPYFEWVPARFVDWYITEEGVLSADDIRGISFSRAELEERMFGDL